MGGPPTAANLTLHRSAHNLYAAEQDFGREHIDRRVATSRLDRNARAAPHLAVQPVTVQGEMI
jgi:hypothetical protein